MAASQVIHLCCSLLTCPTQPSLVDIGHQLARLFLLEVAHGLSSLEPDRLLDRSASFASDSSPQNIAAQQHVSAKHGNATRQCLFSCRVLAKERPALGGPRGIIPSSLVGFVAFVRGDP